MTEHDYEDCYEKSHEWRVHLRSDYIVEVHAVDEETAKQIAEDQVHNGVYDLGSVVEVVAAWTEED